MVFLVVWRFLEILRPNWLTTTISSDLRQCLDRDTRVDSRTLLPRVRRTSCTHRHPYRFPSSQCRLRRPLSLGQCHRRRGTLPRRPGGLYVHPPGCCPIRRNKPWQCKRTTVSLKSTVSTCMFLSTLLIRWSPRIMSCLEVSLKTVKLGPIQSTTHPGVLCLLWMNKVKAK